MESPSMLAPTVNVVSPSSPFIQRFYIILKAHYFLFFAALGVIFPILNITLRSRGLSNTELSYINIIIPFLVFFTNPLSGFIADHSRRYLLTFNICLSIAAISYVIIFILPSVKTHNIQADMIYDNRLGHVLDFCASQEVSTQCASRSQCGCSYQANCTLIDSSYHRNSNQMKRISFIFSMNSKNIYKEIKDATDIKQSAACGIEYRVPIDQAIKQYTQFARIRSSPRLAICEITCSIAHFCRGPRYDNQMRFILLYSLLFVLGTNFMSNAIPLGISIGFANIHHPDIFGKQRVWGTIGFGIIAFAASRLYKIFQTEFVYIIMFSITTIMCIIVTSFIHIQPNKQNQSLTLDENITEKKEIDDLSTVKKKKKSQFKLFALLPLLKNIDVIVFLSLTFIWGMSYAVLDPYLFLYIDEIAACQSRSIIGWMSLVASIFEVTGLFLAERILKLLGTNLSSVIILLAFTIRFGGYYFIRQPYFLIFMETMHFFNFGILFVLIAKKAEAIAPAGLSGTLQGVALGVSFGLGRGIGLVASSFIYTLLQQRLLFLIFSLFNLITAIIFSFYFIINRQHSKKSMKENNNPPIIVIESDIKLNEEPLLIPSTNNKSDNEINE